MVQTNYDIIKAHAVELKVDSKELQLKNCIIHLPF